MVGRRRSSVVAALLAALVLLLPSIALAGYANSGVIYQKTVFVAGHGNTRICLEAWVVTNGIGTGVVSQGGATRAYDASGGNCDGPRTLGTGWLSVTIDGFRSGAFCGTTGYRYTPNPISYMWYQSTLCPNPAGSQVFNTRVLGQVWNGSGAYVDIWPGQWSPNQNG